MPNLEAPSFSLGLDLDADSEPWLHTGDNPDPTVAPDSSAVKDDLEQVMDSDLDSRPDPPRVLKRLRRAADIPSATKKLLEKPPVGNECDDEIEGFSSPEKNDVGSSTKYRSVCGSSKIPLRGLGVLTTQSSLQRGSMKKGQASDATASASSEARHDLLIFPKLTISPLRRFQLLDSDSDGHMDCKDSQKETSLGLSSASSQARHDRLKFPKSISPRKIQLIDSDSDDPTAHKDASEGAQKIDPLPKEQQFAVGAKPQNMDLWKDFFPKDGSQISTPAFDGICKEYFQSAKDKNAAQKPCDFAESVPLAYHYFSHADPRIQKLVRSRLPFFSPSGMVNNNRGNQLSNASMIDYRSQFSNEESCKQKAPQKGGGKKCSSSSRRNKSRKSNAENTASEGWIDPKSSAAIPANTRKQRVHAGGEPAGHWYTSPEGRKVYVSKSGQEFSGQTAYRNYLKESKASLRKSKKKSNVKKKKG